MAYFRTCARWGAFTAMMAGLASLASACTDLLEVDDHRGVADELCNLIEQCYGPDLYPDCHARVAERLQSANPEVRAQYLESFANDFCLESCANARACLDGAPLCDGSGQACSGIEQCCGFAGGGSECKGGACCVALGGACDDSTPCCAGECQGGTCGGVICKKEGQSCATQDCCGELICDLADDKTCQGCEPLMGACASNFDCCKGTTCDLAAGICVASGCGVVGDECSDVAPCCDALICVDDASSDVRVCSTGDCLPELAACGANSPPCCTSECEFGICGSDCSGLAQGCDVLNPCCQQFGCLQGKCCSLPGHNCGQDGDCCSGSCHNSVCEEPLECKNAGSCLEPSQCCSGNCELIATVNQETVSCCAPLQACGTPCTIHNGPLHPSCTWGNTSLGNAGASSCVTAICAEMPECCCSSWSAACAQAAKTSAACQTLACATTQ